MKNIFLTRVSGTAPLPSTLFYVILFYVNLNNVILFFEEGEMAITNWELKRKIAEQKKFGIYQKHIGIKIGIGDNRLSHIVCGRAEPTENEMRLIAKELNCKISEIFPEVKNNF